MEAKNQISEGDWNSLQYDLEVARKTRLTLEKKLTEIEKKEEANRNSIMIGIDAIPVQQRARFSTLDSSAELLEAAKLGNSLLMTEILSRASVSALKLNYNYQDENGFTALHWSVQVSSLECVQKLVKLKDVNVNVKDQAGFTPLHYAANSGSIEICALLMLHPQIDPNIANYNGKKAIDIAKTKEIGIIIRDFKHKPVKRHSDADENTKRQELPTFKRSQSYKERNTKKENMEIGSARKRHSEPHPSLSSSAKQATTRSSNRNRANATTAPADSLDLAIKASLGALGLRKQSVLVQALDLDDKKSKGKKKDDFHENRGSFHDIYTRNIKPNSYKPIGASPPVKSSLRDSGDNISSQTKRRGRTVLFGDHEEENDSYSPPQPPQTM